MMSKKRFLYWFRLIAFAVAVILIVYFLFQLLFPAPNHTRDQQRLIQWGHDTPFLQDIPAYADQLATLPFDGLILDIQSPNDRRGLSWTLFEDPVDTELLTAIREQFTQYEWGKLTDNFLRVNMYRREELTWDDWSIPLDNLAQMATLANDLGFVGIMLDTEQYNTVDLFDFPAQSQKTSQPFDHYRELAFQRGVETIQALQEAYPDITVMFTYGITHRLNWFNAPPLDQHRYGLLVPYIEGMIHASSPTVKLIDGYEGSYLFRTEDKFSTLYWWIRNGVSTQLADGERYRDVMQAGFGLWLDPYCGDGGLPESGCGFTQDELTQALSLALKYSDRYVWLYSEHVDWFDNTGIPQSWWETFTAFDR